MKKSKNQGVARLELRFESEVYAGVRKLAEGAGVSINQLMQALARWAVDNGHVGSPVLQDGSLEVTTKAEYGCLWFGDAGGRLDDGQEYMGEVLFGLDFSDRRAVRDDWRDRADPTVIREER
jgi:hypothetical protein